MRITLNAASSGTLMNNLREVAHNLIKDMEKNHHSWGNARERSVKASQKVKLNEVIQFDHMNAKVDALC